MPRSLLVKPTRDARHGDPAQLPSTRSGGCGWGGRRSAARRGRLGTGGSRNGSCGRGDGPPRLEADLGPACRSRTAASWRQCPRTRRATAGAHQGSSGRTGGGRSARRASVQDSGAAASRSDRFRLLSGTFAMQNQLGQNVCHDEEAFRHADDSGARADLRPARRARVVPGSGVAQGDCRADRPASVDRASHPERPDHRRLRRRVRRPAAIASACGCSNSAIW